MARKKKKTEQPVVAAEPTVTEQNIGELTVASTQINAAGIADSMEKEADRVSEIGKKVLEVKPKADTIPMLFIQHKKSKFATLIPEAEFMAHDEGYRSAWNIVDRAPKAKD